MKSILLAILVLALCGCGAITQPASQPKPGQMATGNWEFILQYGGTKYGYAESNIESTNTPGAYNDREGGSKLFVLDQAVYLADPAAGGGYEFGATVYAFTLAVNSQLQVKGTLAQDGGPAITFTGTVASGGTTMSGTFDDGAGGTGSFTASVAQILDGSYADTTLAINETIAGNVITEGSQYGSGNYNLMSPVGNFAVLRSDIPTGGNGTIVFWNNTGICTGNQCALWRDVSTGNVWVLVNNQNTPPTNKVVDVVNPVQNVIN